MNRILVIDSETIDLPSNIVLTDEELKELGYESVDKLPLAYQISYMYDNGSKRVFADCIGKPVIPISIASSEITHVTNKDVDELTLKEDGSYASIREAKEFKDLEDLLAKVNNEEIYVVGHNISYDVDVLSRENIDLSKCKLIDTLQLARFFDKDSEAYRLTYLTYAKEEVLEATREMIKLDQLKNIAKIQPLSAHNSLFDVVATNYLLTHYRDRLLEMNKDLTLENVYEELHKIATTPFLIEEVPFGGSKGKIINELNASEIFWIYKMDINEINFKYSLDKRIEALGGMENLVKQMSNYDIEKLLGSNPDYFTNEDFKDTLKKELDSRSNGIVTLGFGKHKDEDIQALKTDYLVWVRDNNSNPTTMKKVTQELDRRSGLTKNIDTNIEKKPEEQQSKAIEDNALEDFLNS